MKEFCHPRIRTKSFSHYDKVINNPLRFIIYTFLNFVGSEDYRKEAFKRGLLDTPITLHFKTSALVDDYRF